MMPRNDKKEFTSDLQRDLLQNEERCVNNNLTVHVHTIDRVTRVAHCSVMQRHVGLLRRRLSDEQLVHDAREAVAPLIRIGLMMNVTPLRRLTNGPVRSNAPHADPLGDDLRRVWRWLGYPFAARDRGAHTVPHDPFGWRQAMRAARQRAGN